MKKYYIFLTLFIAFAITSGILGYLLYKEKKNKRGGTASPINDKLKAIKVSDTSMTVKVAGSPTYAGEISADKTNCPDGYMCVELADGGYVCKKIN